jgi:hypothetical protein
MMTRQEMIQLLVADRLEHGSGPAGYLWLEKAIEFGFVGYANMADAELATEVGRRRLDGLAEVPVHDDDPQWDEEAASLALGLRGAGEFQGAQ